MVKTRTTQYWIPTLEANEKLTKMLMENSLNSPYKDGRLSLAERFWATGNSAASLKTLPSNTARELKRYARKLLRPWPKGRYTPSYRRSGGILNIFTPPWGKQEDELWEAMLDEWRRQDFPNDTERQEARRALKQKWNHTPHPFFARLTPAQVMIGGGEQEAELTKEFTKKLNNQFSRRQFESEGQALVDTLTFLRAWAIAPGKDGQTPSEIIIAERTALLARREELIQQREASSQGE